MHHSIKHILAAGGLGAALLDVLGCSPHRVPPLSVDDLMEDRVTLDGILLKCDQDPTKVRNPSDCENARIANERLAAQRVDPEVEKRRQADFEKAREQLRLVQEKARQEQESKVKVDGYTLPVVPVDPNTSANKADSPSAPPTSNSGGPPLAGNAPH